MGSGIVMRASVTVCGRPPKASIDSDIESFGSVCRSILISQEAAATAISKFAMTFNGYEYFGSFDASVDAAASRDRSSLALIRNDLFFAARGSRNGDDDRFVDVYQQLLPRFAAQAVLRISTQRS